jgi:hypothetical protein
MQIYNTWLKGFTTYAHVDIGINGSENLCLSDYASK